MPERSRFSANFTFRHFSISFRSKFSPVSRAAAFPNAAPHDNLMIDSSCRLVFSQTENYFTISCRAPRELVNPARFPAPPVRDSFAILAQGSFLETDLSSILRNRRFVKENAMISGCAYFLLQLT